MRINDRFSNRQAIEEALQIGIVSRPTEAVGRPHPHPKSRLVHAELMNTGAWSWWTITPSNRVAVAGQSPPNDIVQHEGRTTSGLGLGHVLAAQQLE